MLYTKEQLSTILNKNIRQDTYLFINRMLAGETYEEVKEDLESNPKKYNITNLTHILSKKPTILNYLELIMKTTLQEVQEETIEDVKPFSLTKNGIYAICVQDTIIYIGQTSKEFAEIFKSHKQNLMNFIKTNNPALDRPLYRILKKAYNNNNPITLRPLISFDSVRLAQNKKLTARDKDMMTLSLITLYQPKGNINGRIKDFY